MAVKKHSHRKWINYWGSRHTSIRSLNKGFEPDLKTNTFENVLKTDLPFVTPIRSVGHRFRQRSSSCYFFPEHSVIEVAIELLLNCIVDILHIDEY